MNRRHRPACLPLALVIACGVLAASVAIPYSQAAYADGDGRDAATLPEAAGPVAFETERHGSRMMLYGNNPLFGPAEVRLSANPPDGAQSQPGLPLRRVLAGNRRVLLAQVDNVGARTGFTLESVPGDPLTEPRDVVYSLPLDASIDWQLGQGFHGGFSHGDDANRYAVDLIVDEGTPVLAARGGVVMQVESGFGRGSADKSRDFARANVVRILHDDGSMALYAHLKENGVLVKPGEIIGIGQMIALSGNTGYTSGPHLHFCIQVNQGMRLVSIPFRMVGPHGYLPMGSP